MSESSQASGSKLLNRIDAKGQKKILTCDGGGILGLMSVEILAKIEADLRARLGADDKFVLADYFDFVCGTSTGAIIAACISTGMSVAQIRQFYLDSGKQMFDPAGLLERLKYKYEDEPLAKKLQAILSETLGTDSTLGSPSIRTLLMMVMRNATTDSPWPICNNPRAKYNQRQRPDCNLDIPLWQLVRASTAAPTYFPPETITLNPKSASPYSFIFVDGGVTTYNNPAYLAFQMATAKPYAINWPIGKDRLLVVSIGTGGAARGQANLKASEMNLLYSATTIPGALMNAASAGWDMACRSLGSCQFGGPIDREFGAMLDSDPGAPNFSGPKLFTYLRYDPDVSREGLDALGLKNVNPDHVQKLDSIDYMDEIRTVGTTFAQKYVVSKHFEGFA
jgi:patatin-like phospholipase/acyl hydrolase